MTRKGIGLDYECESCEGAGSYYYTDQWGRHEFVCDFCHGTGEIEEE